MSKSKQRRNESDLRSEIYNWPTSEDEILSLRGVLDLTASTVKRAVGKATFSIPPSHYRIVCSQDNDCFKSCTTMRFVRGPFKSFPKEAAKRSLPWILLLPVRTGNNQRKDCNKPIKYVILKDPTKPIPANCGITFQQPIENLVVSLDSKQDHLAVSDQHTFDSKKLARLPAAGESTVPIASALCSLTAERKAAETSPAAASSMPSDNGLSAAAILELTELSTPELIAKGTARAAAEAAVGQ